MKCNLCGYKGEFLPMGTRKNARCPVCKSLERHRDIIKEMELSGDVLHISPNAGLETYIRKTGVNYTKSFVENKGYDLEKPIDRKFDHVIAIHVLEHVEDDLTALKNVHECLNDGGIFWLQVPFEKEPSKEHGHKSNFTERGLKGKLTRAGFTSEVFDKKHKFFKCVKK